VELWPLQESIVPDGLGWKWRGNEATHRQQEIGEAAVEEQTTGGAASCSCWNRVRGNRSGIAAWRRCYMGSWVVLRRENDIG